MVKIWLPASSSTATPVNIPSPSAGAVQRTEPTKSDVSVKVNISSMYRASCPIGFQINFHLFERNAPAHQTATHCHRFCAHVVDGRRGADSSLLAASWEEGIPHGLAGSHPGHPNAGQVKAQDPSDGAVRDHLHRSAHQFPSAMSGNREFSQGFHLRPDAQGTVPGELKIFREIHHRFRVNEMALLVVKVEDGTARLGGPIHEDQIGNDVLPIGEMRKVQGTHSPEWLRPGWRGHYCLPH